MLTRTGLLLGLAVLTGACEQVRAVVCEPAKAMDSAAKGGAGGGKASAAAKAGAAGAGQATEEAHPAENAEPEAPHEPKENEHRAEHPPKNELLTSTNKFALPFAWEKSPTEPLSRARAFLREMADDNIQYAAKGAAFFKPLMAAETPRTTVLTCTDSRVQSGAYDATPENDDYVVRNLGNQLEPSLGSVQYGVGRLATPVLMILGHTGCSAIKAALTESRELDEPVRRELAGISIKKVKGPFDDKKLTAAVMENVHDQVRAALKQFGARVNAGELTIVGAVHDLRNDLGKGAGRLSVINVNGIQDEARLKAFGDAIMAAPNPRAKQENPLDRLARVLAESAAVSVHDEDEDEEEEEEPTPKPAPPPAAAPKKPAAAEPAHAAPQPPEPEPTPKAPAGATLPASRAAPGRGKSHH
ncbi:MAG: carbonic anhydrase [Polyangiales bacterium]